MPPRFVVDASVVVELLLERPLPGSIHTALRGTRAVAPTHLDVEVLSALRGLVRRGDLDAGSGRRALRRLATAAIRRAPLGPLLDPAWELRDNLTAYDALYVALARQLACPLLTADRRLAAAPDLGIAVTVV